MLQLGFMRGTKHMMLLLFAVGEAAERTGDGQDSLHPSRKWWDA